MVIQRLELLNKYEVFFFTVNTTSLHDYIDNTHSFFEIAVKETDTYISFNHLLILILHFMGYFIKCIISYFLYPIKENPVSLSDILLAYIARVNFSHSREQFYKN